MKIAVSSCLLGNKVRFDGGHKRDSFVIDELGKFAKFISFCPESIAFSTPRDSIRIVNRNEERHFLSNKTGEDVTEKLLEASRQDLESIKSDDIRAIILKSKSPSCGLGSAKLYLENGMSSGKTDGMFAQMCKENFPLLPIEEEGRLNDPWLRENFVMQLFAYDAFEEFKASKPQMKELVVFHQNHKFLLQSKDEFLYRELGKIVGNHDKKEFTELLEEYETAFKTAISKKSSVGKTRNILEHMAGFLKKEMNDVEKRALHEQIGEYSQKIVPLIVPLSTLKMFALKYENEYLNSQVFLEPYPKELALRSEIRSSK